MPVPEGFIEEEPQGFVSDEPSALGKAIRSAASAFTDLGPQAQVMQQAVPKVAAVTQDLKDRFESDAGSVLVDALNRSGLDPSARLGAPIGGEYSRIPLLPYIGTKKPALSYLIGDEANKGVEEKAAELFNEIRTPEQVSTLPTLSTKPAQVLMAAQALAQVPQDVESVISAQTPQERGSAGLGGAVNALIAYGLGRHLLKGTPPAAVTEGETPAASAVSSAQGGEAVTSPTKPATVEPTVTEPVAQVVAATHTDPETGITTTGANHPQAREAQGVEPGTRKSREKGDDGFLVQSESTQVNPLAQESTESIVSRTKVGAERDSAFSERAKAIKSLSQSLKPGDVVIDEDGVRRVVRQVMKDGTLFLSKEGSSDITGSEYQLGHQDRIERATQGTRVVSRKEGEAVAQESGQALPKEGEQIHSDEVKSPVDPTKPLSEVPQKPQIVGMGGAAAGELPQTGAGGDIYGTAQEFREQRARAGQVEPVEPGQGVNPQQAFERGRQLLAQGFDAPKALESFLKTDKATYDDVVAIRAYGEALAAGARNIEEHSGTDSPQYREAYKALSDWDKRSKGLATLGHEIMVAHQGFTDLDTGSFTSLQRFYEAATDKPFKAPDAKAAEKIAKVNENAQKAVSKVVTEVNNVFQTDPVEPHVLSLAQRITDALDKTAGDALKRIQARRAEGRLFTGIDPVELADYALYGASKIAKGAVEFSKWSAEMTADIGDYIKDHLKQIWDASNERLDETVERSVPDKERIDVKRTIRKQSALDAEKDALAAASRTVRENAIRIAKLDTKSRVAQTVADQELLEKQKAPELKAVKSAQQLTIKEAIKSAKEASKVDEKTVIDEQQKASERALKAAHDITKREAIRTAREASEVKERSGPSEQSKSAAEALESVNKIAVENAIRRAKLENKYRLEKVASEQKLIATQKSAAIKALKIAQEMERKATLRVAKEAARVKEEADLNEQQKATDAALEAANKVVRDNAKRVADAENKKRSATQAKEKKAAIEERRLAEVALRKSQNEARQAAIKAAKAERANQANPMKRVWKAVRGYLDKGETDQDTIRTKVATDLGMKPEQVYRLLARDERVKRLMDDMWLKQQTARRLKENAKRWVMSLDEPKFKKFLESVPNAMFRAKVFGHMGVAFGTHAPAVGFLPQYWGDLARDYGKMWGMGFSKTFYERQIQDLMNRKNFVPANRFGLDNHPERFEEYNPKGKTNMGGRSYTALKFIRQDIFDKIWDNLPKTEQTDDVGWAIANRINHMTGTLSTKAPPKSLQGRMKADVKPPTNAAKALFAPTLLFSRYRFIFGDTLQDIGILTHWSTASPGERAAVKIDVNHKLWVAGTGLALLTANAGLLSATGSKQKINFTDPTRSDWLKFKAFGLTFSPGNAMLSMARIIPREIMTIAGSKKAREDENAATKAWEFARGQMSPFAGTATDLFFGSDYSGRPLPRKLFGTMEQKAKVPLRQREQGVKPYTWPEYALQQASPIPFQEGLREIWHNGWGMSDKQIDGFLKALEISGIMGTTGARVAEDWETKK